MKKLFSTSFLFMAVYAAALHAQFLLGGNMGFNSLKSEEEFGGNRDESTYTIVNFVPRLAYVMDKGWVGVEAGLSAVTDKDENDDKDVTQLIQVGPFYRHIHRVNDHFGMWIEAQAGAVFGGSKFNDQETAKYFGFNAGLRPGVLFFIGDHFSFEASFGRFGYSSLTEEDPDDSDNKTTASSLGFSLNNNGVDLGSILTANVNGTFLAGFQFGVNYTFGGGSAEESK